MIFILSEQQSENLSNRNKAKIVSMLFEKFYPDWELSEREIPEETDVMSEDKTLFIYRWTRKEFSVSINFIEYLHQLTGLNFLDIKNHREEFDQVMKEFTKFQFGWKVDRVHFHWYD